MDGNDTLKGGAGDDELFGEAGDDLLIGGTGNDSYNVEDTGDKIQEAANGGIDTIRAVITLTLGDNIENAKLEVGVTVTGNALNNVIEGSVGQDKILGGDGNDTLSGLLDVDTLTVVGTGNDVLDGGLGADIMEGARTSTQITFDAFLRANTTFGNHSGFRRSLHEMRIYCIFLPTFRRLTFGHITHKSPTTRIWAVEVVAITT